MACLTPDVRMVPPPSTLATAPPDLGEIPRPAMDRLAYAMCYAHCHESIPLI
jgi:hypothetical protein